jgi:hypothetical protein
VRPWVQTPVQKKEKKGREEGRKGKNKLIWGSKKGRLTLNGNDQQEEPMEAELCRVVILQLMIQNLCWASI